MRGMDALTSYSRESNDLSYQNSGEKQRQGNFSSDSRQQFSFNRQLKKNNESFLKQKYSEIYNDLKVMKIDDVIDLLLEELEENQKYTLQISHQTNRINCLEEELADSRQALKKKSEAINLLCETQSRNLQLIEKLENKIAKKNDFGRDTHYEKKYQQLSVYMNQYIRNINMAQEQFKKAYTTLKSENTKLSKQVQGYTSQCCQLAKKIQVLTHRLKRSEDQLTKFTQLQKKMTINLNILNQQNTNLRKEIEVYQQNIRITDRLQIHFSNEHNQISSDLDFIRQKICQNENISKDIIEKLEESSSNCQRVYKAKDQALASLQKNCQKTSELQKQVSALRRRNQSLQQELDECRKQLQYMLKEKDEVEEDLAQQKIQKQSIRHELLNLADKVRLMESSYRKQIEQSQKIKGQLFKFWQNKERKQGMMKDINCKVLSEIKINGDYSQSTFSQSQKQSKLSLWNKKSDQETTSNLHEKQNIEEHFSQDSLNN